MTLNNKSHYGSQSEENMESINAFQFELLTPVFVYICILMILGIPGNIISILVYGLQLKSATGRYAIISLALCDIINCVMSIPMELYMMTRYWSFDNTALCKMSRFVTYAMNNSSALILVAIAFERYRTICTPHKSKIKSKYIKMTCVSMMISGTVLALPVLWIYGIETESLFVEDDHLRKEIKGQLAVLNITKDMPARQWYDNEFGNITLTKRCRIDDMIKSPFLSYSMFGFLTISGVIILFILIVIYGQIAWKIRGLKRIITTAHDLERKRASTNRKMQVTFMLFLITMVFQFSFIPFIVITNIRYFTDPDWYNDQPKAGKMVYHFFLRSYLTNCAANPFIYCISSTQFRTAIFSLHKRLKSELVCIVCRRSK